MSSAGLSRRRVPGSSSNSAIDDDGDVPSRTASSRSGPSNGTTAPAHAGSAFEGGGKIAYDPRDIDLDANEEAKIGGKMPRLTIMEEVLLLGIKDKQVRIFSRLRFCLYVYWRCKTY